MVHDWFWLKKYFVSFYFISFFIEATHISNSQYGTVGYLIYVCSATDVIATNIFRITKRSASTIQEKSLLVLGACLLQDPIFIHASTLIETRK